MSVTPTNAAVIFDGASLDDWDDEELMRGQRRGKHGKFGTNRPQVVPARMVQELTRRRFSRAHVLMAASLEDAAEMLRSVINDDNADVFARLKAADMIFDRILGKPREQIAIDLYAEVEGKEHAWKSLTRRAIVATAAEAMDLLSEEREQEIARAMHGEVVDAELVEEADDE